MPFSPRQVRTFSLIVVVAILGAGALLVLGLRDDDKPSSAELAERDQSCQRLLMFGSLLSDPSFAPTASPEAGQAGVANLFSKMGGDIELLVPTAPGKVRDDVRTLVDALRASGGDQAALRAPAFVEAEQRLATFLNDPGNGCQAGSESGNG